MKTIIMKCLRTGYQRLAGKTFPSPWKYPEISERIHANTIINDGLESNQPFFVGRVGTVEGNVVLNYLTVHENKPLLNKLVDYVTDNTKLPWWDTGRPFKELSINAGFFSQELSIYQIEKFCNIYLDSIRNLDVCGRFMYNEKFFPFKSDCQMVQLEALYPFFVSNPWTAALKDKKVVVVHPFRDTIISQYKKRNYLFENPDTLPDFDLKVIKAVQSIAGEKSIYKDWFEALESMQEAISMTEFDIAILGCGAYGLPLASFVKNMGKKAIHMGGGTQLLFGIKGKRWEQYEDSSYRDQFNEHWVYPSETERPRNAHIVEGACYW